MRSLLKTVRTAWFKSEKQLQRIKLIITLKIDNKDITNELRKVVFENSFAVRLIE